MSFAPVSRLLMRHTVVCLCVAALFAQTSFGAELSIEDFRFDGPNGSQGAVIERVGVNHFRITLGHAPNHPTWCNMLYFEITRNARGNSLRLDVGFPGGDAYRFNHNSATWSYDRKTWRSIAWGNPEEPSKRGDSLIFPEFSEDVVYFGPQVPVSYEEILEFVRRWEKHPDVTVHEIGKSLAGRPLVRVEITNEKSDASESSRWVHWIGNQHPGEHNAQWRIIGMVEWLLSDAGADARRRSVCHFVPMTSPDALPNGWYRVNAQGVDMNRSYFPDGSDRERQAHEAFVVQSDLERLMALPSPVTSVWSMHTWGGPVEPILIAGPEIGTKVGPWEDLRSIIQQRDPRGLIEPLKAVDKPGGGNHWNNGPHIQFGITNVLCEGAGDWTSKQDCLDAGAILMQSITEYYSGLKTPRK